MDKIDILKMDNSEFNKYVKAIRDAPTSCEEKLDNIMELCINLMKAVENIANSYSDSEDKEKAIRKAVRGMIVNEMAKSEFHEVRKAVGNADVGALYEKKPLKFGQSQNPLKLHDIDAKGYVPAGFSPNTKAFTVVDAKKIEQRLKNQGIDDFVADLASGKVQNSRLLVEKMVLRELKRAKGDFD